LAAELPPGNVHSADDWEELLLPEIERQQKQGTGTASGNAPQKLGRNRGDLAYPVKSSDAKTKIPVNNVGGPRYMRRGIVLMSAIAMLASAPFASASVIFETLQSATFYDGGVASGSFAFDTVSGTVTSWSISVSGGDIGTFPPFTYSPIDSTVFVGSGDLGFPLTAFDFSTGTRAIRILLQNSLPPGGGTDPFHIWPNGELGHIAGFECFECNPFRNFSGGSLNGTVPEPATVALVGVSLIGLVVLRLRNRGSGSGQRFAAPRSAGDRLYRARFYL
jgi:hypothetical protein